MVAFTHLSMVGFLILGLSMVRLLITLAALLHQNTNESKDDDVIFYWPHTIFCFITFFTIILFLVDILSVERYILLSKRRVESIHVSTLPICAILILHGY